MPAIQSERITVSYDDQPAVQGNISLEVYSGGERTMAAAKLWLGAWFLAVLAAFVPLAHFVLVPALVIGGVVVGYRAYNRACRANAAEFTCPACREPVNVKLEPHQIPPVYVYCPKCEASLKVERS